MNLILSFLSSFVLCILLVPVVMYILKSRDITDTPGGRKIHQGKIPSMGGIGIVLSLLIASFFWLGVAGLQQLNFIFLAIIIVAIIGFSDDLFDLSPRMKLLGQLFAIILLIGPGDLYLSNFQGFLGLYELPKVIAYPLTIFLLISLTNSFNLIDGLDGLAGTLALITFTFFAVWFYRIGELNYALFCVITLGAILGFLLYNWHPAKIFMGDTGSLSLGFILAVIVLVFVEKNSMLSPTDFYKFHSPFAASFAFLIVPVYDTLRVFYRRIKRGKSPFHADKSHVHHFLMRSGLTHDRVAFMLGFIKVAFIALALIGAKLSEHVMFPILITLAILLGIRLESYTLKKVKHIAKNSPRILDEAESRIQRGRTLNSNPKAI
ncbi:MAG: MraY family glycosyltransferase [Nitritalea sp.]